ncbi:hypothetical protein GQ53DRAFT_752198 [Thozetella sp. PMI_491]|nr:hypothetical protein GQ53DRAFT_752198 [Thozetella sp. PMI_491]
MLELETGSRKPGQVLLFLLLVLLVLLVLRLLLRASPVTRSLLLLPTSTPPPLPPPLSPSPSLTRLPSCRCSLTRTRHPSPCSQAALVSTSPGGARLNNPLLLRASPCSHVLLGQRWPSPMRPPAAGWTRLAGDDSSSPLCGAFLAALGCAQIG